MNDRQTTIADLKSEIIAMCRRKGWGIDGIQDPQHVAMAMSVEVMEFLEHFEKDLSADDAVDTEEELADVLMYAMQIMHTLKINVSKEIAPHLDDASARICELKAHVGEDCGDAFRSALRIAVRSRFLLEEFQWMLPGEVESMVNGELPDKVKNIAQAFSEMFREILCFANIFGMDISGSIGRKIGIVDRRPRPEDDPVR